MLAAPGNNNLINFAHLFTLFNLIIPARNVFHWKCPLPSLSALLGSANSPPRLHWFFGDHHKFCVHCDCLKQHQHSLAWKQG